MRKKRSIFDLVRRQGSHGGTGIGQPSPDVWMTYSIELAAGDTKWSTMDQNEDDLPRCEVGAWDKDAPFEVPDGYGGLDLIDSLLNWHVRGDPTRDMDCRWTC